MSNFKLQIPNGMQDTLPGECRARRELEEKFRAVFLQHGYQEIETPGLEYYDALNDKTYGYRPEHVWKTFDRSGRVLALRPDSTIPCARLAAGTLSKEPLPLRLSYLQSASNFQSDTLSMLCEQPQAGLELMGEDAAAADAEVLYIAIAYLETAGLADYQIELGHMGFFSGFMQDAGLNEEQIHEVRNYLERKDSWGMQLYLQSIHVSSQVSERLTRLPRLYGTVEILDEAARLTENPVCHQAIERIRTVIRLVRVFGCKAELTIDLGMAQEAGYYSGLVFRGHAAGVGQPILSGGRYDGLTARFGRELPAVGFALMTKLLMIALERQGKVFAPSVPDYIVGGAPECIDQVIERSQELRRCGYQVLTLYADSPEKMQEHRVDGKQQTLIWISKPEGEEKEADS